jgi:hypothetical protein
MRLQKNCCEKHPRSSALILLPSYARFQLSHKFGPVIIRAIFAACYRECRKHDAIRPMVVCFWEVGLIDRLILLFECDWI